MKRLLFLSLVLLQLAACNNDPNQDLILNDLEYFEAQGVNILVYSNLFTGGFNDEKTAGIELIHHGVRTAQGGAVRLSNTPDSGTLFLKYQPERLTVCRIPSSRC
jgi:endoglucanase